MACAGHAGGPRAGGLWVQWHAAGMRVQLRATQDYDCCPQVYGVFTGVISSERGDCMDLPQISALLRHSAMKYGQHEHSHIHGNNHLSGLINFSFGCRHDQVTCNGHAELLHPLLSSS